MTARTVLLLIGAAFWLGALAGWLRDRRAAKAAVFVVFGLPFIVAGAFYANSSYPGDAVAAPAPLAATPVPPRAETGKPPASPSPPPDPAAHAQAVLAAQREAVARHPALGMAGTPFNKAFVAAYHRIRHTEPHYFDDPAWPLRLAEEVAGDLAGAQEQ